MKANKGRIVLDSSVALAWCFHDEADAYADAVAARSTKFDIRVPAIWPLEVANALLMGERRRRSTPADTINWAGFLTALPITVDDETRSRALSDVLNLARALNLSAYDAAYIELAMRLTAPLATLDKKLKTACARAGATIYAVS